MLNSTLIIKKFLWAALATFVVAIHLAPAAKADQKVALYLPVRSEQFADVINQLELAINNSELGTKLTDVEIHTSDFWSQYQAAIRKGKKGIIFAAPHFAAWSIHEHNFTPILKINDPLRYVIASRLSNPEIFEINDLNNKSICSHRPLGLDYLLANTAFSNNMLSANIITVTSVVNEMSNKNSKCSAFSVSNHLLLQLEKEQPNHFIRLQQGRDFSNYAFVIHPAIAVDHAVAIRAFFLDERTQEILQPIFRKTAVNTKLVRARKSDYPIHYTEPLSTYWKINSRSRRR